MIVDASIAIAWVHPGQATPETDALLTAVGQGVRVFAPALWPLEVANALLTLERRKKLRADERVAGLHAIRALPVTLDHEMSTLAFTDLSQMAGELNLSIYDAAYLELAIRLKQPLACRDGPLVDAAKRRRVKVLP
jgi:predicted nucleic acid-binding protein